MRPAINPRVRPRDPKISRWVPARLYQVNTESAAIIGRAQGGAGAPFQTFALGSHGNQGVNGGRPADHDGASVAEAPQSCRAGRAIFVDNGGAGPVLSGSHHLNNISYGCDQVFNRGNKTGEIQFSGHSPPDVAGADPGCGTSAPPPFGDPTRRFHAAFDPRQTSSIRRPAFKSHGGWGRFLRRIGHARRRSLRSAAEGWNGPRLAARHCRHGPKRWLRTGR